MPRTTYRTSLMWRWTAAGAILLTAAAQAQYLYQTAHHLPGPFATDDIGGWWIGHFLWLMTVFWGGVAGSFLHTVVSFVRDFLARRQARRRA